MKQERLEDKLQVDWNGPTMPLCDGAVQTAMRKYCTNCKREKNRDGHFIHQSNGILSYDCSKAVEMLRENTFKLPIMK